MEVDALIEMFERSVKKHGVRYAKYIRDGDSKIFGGILDVDPYVSDSVVIKKECVGDVQKRMDSRLRKAKKYNVGIGGEGVGKLTDEGINELTVYYGLAIRRNSESLENMKNGVRATYHHKSAPDQNPQYQYCPSGEWSWCKWKKAASEGTRQDFVHENPPLNEQVLKVIKPIYEVFFKKAC